ncbi:protein FAR-RED ELONGATED HYPOCOTYL 1 isoform X2 [Quercus suber]|uniref:protein FAR-RED ELONGATED HYPOCOTYL 1 isoform X2 n=1 Tax=Quercus suber TaxID=58331 RepID=UPI0032DEC6CA
MNEYNENPSEINSFQVNKAFKNNIISFNKKRKLHAEQLGLPIPKHGCWDHSFASEDVTVFEKIPKAESFCTNIINGKTGGATMVNNELEPESGEGSNSFAEDSDSAMSIYDEARLQPEYANTHLSDGPSTSSVNCPSNCDYNFLEYGESIEDTLYSNGSNPNTYVLSSRRWNVNQDAQSGTRKPTIDQEFEQYFSMLML